VYCRWTEYNIYTCPANCRAEVTMLMVVNAGGSTTTATVIWYDASKTVDVHILGSKSLSAGDYVLFTGATLVLEAGRQTRHYCRYKWYCTCRCYVYCN
jgi:hypothetical protein